MAKKRELGYQEDFEDVKRVKLLPIGLDQAVPENIIVSTILPKVRGMGLLLTNRYMKSVIFPRVKDLRMRITTENRLQALKQIQRETDHNNHVQSIRITLVGIFDASSWYPFLLPCFPNVKKISIILERITFLNDMSVVQFVINLWKCICEHKYPILTELSIKTPSRIGSSFDNLNLGPKLAINLRKHTLDAPLLTKLDMPFIQYVTSVPNIQHAGGVWMVHNNSYGCTFNNVEHLTLRDFEPRELSVGSFAIAQLNPPASKTKIEQVTVKKSNGGEVFITIGNTNSHSIKKINIELALNIDICRAYPAGYPFNSRMNFGIEEANLLIKYQKNGFKSDILLQWSSMVNMVASSSIYRATLKESTITIRSKRDGMVLKTLNKPKELADNIGVESYKDLCRLRKDVSFCTAETDFWDDSVLAYVTFGCFLAYRAIISILSLDLLAEYVNCDHITMEDCIDLRKFINLVRGGLFGKHKDEGLPGVHFTCNTLELNVRDEQKMYIVDLLAIFNPQKLIINGWVLDPKNVC